MAGSRVWNEAEFSICDLVLRTNGAAIQFRSNLLVSATGYGTVIVSSLLKYPDVQKLGHTALSGQTLYRETSSHSVRSRLILGKAADLSGGS